LRSVHGPPDFVKTYAAPETLGAPATIVDPEIATDQPNCPEEPDEGTESQFASGAPGCWRRFR
jgi:hypothetical protein